MRSFGHSGFPVEYGLAMFLSVRANFAGMPKNPFSGFHFFLRSKI